MVAHSATKREESVAAEGCYEWRTDLSDLEFWAFLAVAVPGLFLPVMIAWWKGRPIIPVALLSLEFWPGALILMGTGTMSTGTGPGTSGGPPVSTPGAPAGSGTGNGATGSGAAPSGK